MRTLLLLLSASMIMLTGCQTKSTAARFEQATAQVLTCQQRVLHYQEQMNKNNIQFTDERNALMYFVVQELARVKETNQIAYCDDLIIAMVQADSAKTQGLIRGGVSLGSVALGLIGLDILMDGTSRGDHSGDTWNISGSRVNSKSGNVSGGGSTTVSSSGEGLGLGNTFATGSGQSVGGIEPRTTPINGDVTTLETGSNSGTNEPVTLPAEPPVEIQPVE
jgi:hypothetical protein